MQYYKQILSNDQMIHNTQKLHFYRKIREAIRISPVLGKQRERKEL